MSTHPFDILPVDTGATFIFTPCPGIKDVSLQTSVSQLKAAGAQAIVTLMYQEEMDKHQASELPNVCQEQGVEWFQLPISDDAGPNQDFEQAWREQLAQIMAILNDKGTIAVHCKGGSGRTGLVIGLLMNQLGIDKQAAKTLVQSIRSKALVNPNQLAFFEQFAG